MSPERPPLHLSGFRWIRRDSARNLVTWISQRLSTRRIPSDSNPELVQRVSSSRHRDSARATPRRVRNFLRTPPRPWAQTTPTVTRGLPNVMLCEIERRRLSLSRRRRRQWAPFLSRFIAFLLRFVSLLRSSFLVFSVPSWNAAVSVDFQFWSPVSW